MNSPKPTIPKSKLPRLDPHDPRIREAVRQQIKEMPFSELDARLAPRNLGVIERQFPDPTPVTREELLRRENQQS